MFRSASASGEGLDGFARQYSSILLEHIAAADDLPGGKGQRPFVCVEFPPQATVEFGYDGDARSMEAENSRGSVYVNPAILFVSFVRVQRFAWAFAITTYFGLPVNHADNSAGSYARVGHGSEIELRLLVSLGGTDKICGAIADFIRDFCGKIEQIRCPPFVMDEIQDGPFNLGIPAQKPVQPLNRLHRQPGSAY